MVRTPEPERKAQPKAVPASMAACELKCRQRKKKPQTVASQLRFDIKNPQRVLKILAYKTEQQPQINQI